MTKHKHSPCLQSPTDAHHWLMSWPEGRYIGTCRFCNEVQEFDATLGMRDVKPASGSPLGRKSELRRAKTGRFTDE